jgi:hypothetical protein
LLRSPIFWPSFWTRKKAIIPILVLLSNAKVCAAQREGEKETVPNAKVGVFALPLHRHLPLLLLLVGFAYIFFVVVV